MQNKIMATYARMQSEEGASMVEYALLVVLIALIALLAVQAAGNQVSSTFSEIESGLSVTN